MRALAATAFVVLAACSSGGGDAAAKDPAAALRAAATRTGESKSVKMEVSVGSGASQIASGEGAFDFEKQLGKFNLKTSFGPSFEFVMTADKIFLKNPNPGEGGKPWMALTEQTAADSPMLGFLDQLRSQVDPRDSLKNLGSTVKDVEKVGTEEIRGEDTTHLRGRVDLSDEAIADAPADLRDSLRQAQEQFGAEGYPVDVWLDGEGRVRRFEYGMNMPIPGGGETKVTLDLFGYGDDPEIEVPKPEDVEEGDPAAAGT